MDEGGLFHGILCLSFSNKACVDDTEDGASGITVEGAISSAKPKVKNVLIQI